MGIKRSSFYYWKKRLTGPAPKTKALADNVILFREYHIKYPSHDQICLIQSLWGVGFLSAVVLIAEMGSFELFSSPKKFMPTLD